MHSPHRAMTCCQGLWENPTDARRRSCRTPTRPAVQTGNAPIVGPRLLEMLLALPPHNHTPLPRPTCSTMCWNYTPAFAQLLPEVVNTPSPPILVLRKKVAAPTLIRSPGPNANTHASLDTRRRLPAPRWLVDAPPR